MKKINLALFFVIIAILVKAQGIQEKPELKFNVNGKFRIVQFTDVHFQYDSYRSDSALILMKRVILHEKPDLVVLTGDIVCSKNTRLAWLSLAKIMEGTKVPWAVTLGNHDIEYELTGKEIMDIIKDLPYNLTSNGPETISGNGNYTLRVKSSSRPETSAVLYFMDSHTGIKPKSEWGSYEWIGFDQIAWYRDQSTGFTRSNGNKPIPSLAFFHIPFPEYKEIIEKSSTIGIYEEKVCSPDINSGLYTAMLEMKDVFGVFTGHDHDNNYIGTLRGIALAYGNVSGRQCYGKIGRGARVIDLYESEKKFDTWIFKLYDCDRDKDIWTRSENEFVKKFFVTYPDSFD